MAKALNPLMSANASGALGGIEFSPGRSGCTIRKRASGSPSRSVAATNSRAFFHNRIDRWKMIDNDMQASWDKAAYPDKGYNLFYPFDYLAQCLGFDPFYMIYNVTEPINIIDSVYIDYGEYIGWLFEPFKEGPGPSCFLFKRHKMYSSLPLKRCPPTCDYYSWLWDSITATPRPSDYLDYDYYIRFFDYTWTVLTPFLKLQDPT